MGVRNFTLEPDGNSIDIIGENGCGKTTLFDAFQWLITDKDSKGNATGYFSLKTKEDGEVLHNLEHSVTGEFDTITLKKIYEENWVTKRGSNNAVLDGHSTSYYIDEEPVKKKEYDSQVESILSPEQFKMLTNPMYFPQELHWKKRRKMLMDLCGDITQNDIIGTDDKLKEYPNILAGKSRKSRRKILKETRKELKEDLEQYPHRIDERTESLYEVDGVDEAKKWIQTLTGKKEKVASKKNEVKSGGAIADLKVEKQKLEAEKARLKNEHQQSLDDSLEDAREKVSGLQDNVDEAENHFREAKRNYQSAESNVAQRNSDISKIEEGMSKLKKNTPKPESDFGPDVCPVCERPMEDGDDHDYQKYLQEFNAEKAQELKAAKEELQQAESDRSKWNQILEVKKRDAAKAKGKLNQRKQALESAQYELKSQKEEQAEFDSSEIDSQIKSVDKKINNHMLEKSKQLDELDELVSGLNDQIEEYQSTVQQAKENERTKKRIGELRSQQKKAGRKLTEVEHQQHIIHLYELAESKLITERVNEMFDYVNWKLFEQQLNGGLKNICSVRVNGIPFNHGLNTGSQIKAGLEIINVFSNHYGKNAPVFIDNMESLTSTPKYDGLQLIGLVAREGVDELKVVGMENTVDAEV